MTLATVAFRQFGAVQSFMDIQGYLTEIRALAVSGQATEHSFRPALDRLFNSISDSITVINEPRRLTDVGAPEQVTRWIPVQWAFVEAG